MLADRLVDGTALKRCSLIFNSPAAADRTCAPAHNEERGRTLPPSLAHLEPHRPARPADIFRRLQDSAA